MKGISIDSKTLYLFLLIIVMIVLKRLRVVYTVDKVRFLYFN